ncbi:MAG: M13 family peptidase, partial [Coprobacter sp.]|nr:M13 family peptidase [Coprobacter sp.]
MKTNGLDISNLDTTVSCKDDFYQYACGGWMEKNPLKPEYSRFGSFDQLVENNQSQLKELIEELGSTGHESGTVAQKVGDLYLLGLDSVRLNQEGYAPLTEELKAINEVNDKDGYSRMMARLQKIGASPFFSFYVGADDMNSSQNLVGLYQSGMSMGDRDYYLLNDSVNLRIREAYAAYIEKL